MNGTLTNNKFGAKALQSRPNNDRMKESRGDMIRIVYKRGSEWVDITYTLAHYDMVLALCGVCRNVGWPYFIEWN